MIPGRRRAHPSLDKGENDQTRRIYSKEGRVTPQTPSESLQHHTNHNIPQNQSHTHRGEKNPTKTTTPAEGEEDPRREETTKIA